MIMFRKATRLARERVDRAFSEHGVRVGQQLVLEELGREDGLTPTDLVWRMGVEIPTVAQHALPGQQRAVVGGDIDE